MIVTIVSRCERAALARTRRIVDQFLPRIADATWMGDLSAEALEELRRRLADRATRRSAVRCYAARGGMVHLLWAVGSRADLDDGGRAAAIGATARDMLRDGDESRETPLAGTLRQVVRLAALFHDLGKATALFQAVLSGKAATRTRQPVRHEVVSALLIAILGKAAQDDPAFLAMLAAEDFAARLETAWAEVPDAVKGLAKPSAALPPFLADPGPRPATAAILFCIFSHHRAPGWPKNDADPWLAAHRDAQALATGFKAFQDQLRPKSELTDHLPWKNPTWCEMVRAAARRLLELLPSLSAQDKAALPRLAAQTGRLALQWGDHAVSREDSTTEHRLKDKERLKNAVFANTAAQESGREARPACPLDSHLLRVAQAADDAFRTLMGGMRNPTLWPTIAEADLPLPLVADPAPPPPAFSWQMASVERLRRLRGDGPDDLRRAPFFAVMPARTGSGKTRAAPRVMAAVSGGLRFTFAVGLRTLTLQTADAYRNQIGFTAAQMAAHVGDRLAARLYDLNQKPEEEGPDLGADFGQEADEMALLVKGGDELAALPKAVERLLPPDEAKWRRLLAAPVAACTIDTLAEAMDRSRGRHLAAELRLASSDLVIDEADAFDLPGLMAMARLAHLTGLYGRKLIVASASLPYALTLGLFKAYAAGVALHRLLTGKDAAVPFYVACLTDQAEAVSIDRLPEPAGDWDQAFTACLDRWTAAEIKRLETARHAERRRMALLPITGGGQTTRESAFDAIIHAVTELHAAHHGRARTAGRMVRFSAGAVRLTHVADVQAFAAYLAKRELPPHLAVRMVVYHSRLFPAVRHAVESLLDRLLLRKPGAGGVDPLPEQPEIAGLLANLPEGATDLLVVVVASPVIEAGRDHDYDWIITEPTSLRSVVQVAGRCLRHRLDRPPPQAANVRVLDYPLAIFGGQDVSARMDRPDEVYRHPGSGDALGTYPDLDQGGKAHASGLLPPAWTEGIDAAPILAPLTMDQVKILAAERRMIAFADLLPLAALMGDETGRTLGKRVVAQENGWLGKYIGDPLDDWIKAGTGDTPLLPWLQWRQEKLYRFRDDDGWPQWQLEPNGDGELATFNQDWWLVKVYSREGRLQKRLSWQSIATQHGGRFLLSFRRDDVGEGGARPLLRLVGELTRKLDGDSGQALLTVTFNARHAPERIEADPTLGIYW